MPKSNPVCMVNLQDSLVEAEEKYRKAMVSNAQLDNEKSNLMYQVDTLRDTLMELEELLYETRRECEDKTKVCYTKPYFTIYLYNKRNGDSLCIFCIMRL